MPMPIADKSKKKDLRRSNSFTKEEVLIACDIFLGLLSRKDVSILVNRKEFNSLTARFLKMRESIKEDEQQVRKSLSEIPATRSRSDAEG